MFRLVAFGAILTSASATTCQAAWAQCGGQDYSGETCCTSGNACTFVNTWWSSCQPASDPTPHPTPAPTDPPSDPTPDPTPSPTAAPPPTPDPTPAPTSPPVDAVVVALSGDLMYATNTGAMGTFTPEYITKDTFGDVRESDASKDNKEITYYAGEAAVSQTGSGTGNCAFSNVQNLEAFDNVDGWVAVSKAKRYEKSMACGMCVQYRGKGGSNGGVDNPIPTTWQKAIVVDACEACENDAFEKPLVELDLSDSTGDGRWDIEWKSVECEVASAKFQYTFVSGSSNWSIKMQIRNHKVPVYKVEMKGRKNVDDLDNADSEYKYYEMRRSDDNHWLANGNYTPDLARNWQRPYGKYVGAVTGTSWGTYESKLEIRITSIFGEQVEDEVDFQSPAILTGLSYANPITGTVQFDAGTSASRRLEEDLELMAPHW